MSLILRESSREIKITPHINPYSYGSVIVEFGNTKVHITATVEENLPSWLKGQGKGWVTAEYSMLPGSTHTRSRRERSKIGGRTYEIQRLIGRSLRSVVDLVALGERSIVVDCDVLVADGGTRTASITGAYVALKLAIKKLMDQGELKQDPITEQLGSISIGINRDGKIIADLNYDEDSTCKTDMNLVMTRSGKFVEIQGTAEEEPFSMDELNGILETANKAMEGIYKAQDQALS
jgi:ribonuclease PH